MVGSGREGLGAGRRRLEGSRRHGRVTAGSKEPISARQIGGKTRYQAKRVAEIGGDAAVAFAEGCSFSIREPETRDWAVVWRAASLAGSKRDLVGAKQSAGGCF